MTTPTLDATDQLDPYRLPRTAVPSRYDLHLRPDLPSSSFTGSVRIVVDVVEPIVVVVGCTLVVVVVDGAGHGAAIAWRTSHASASSRRSMPPAAPPKLTQ